MLTRIEIDGFKSFESFALDLAPFTAIVGPNASGKSNLFDALRFVSLLAQFDIRTAMQDLRGEPEELFRHTRTGTSSTISLAIEVLLARTGTDAFGTSYEVQAQRLRYTLKLELLQGADGTPRGMLVREEDCRPLSKKEETAAYLKQEAISYSGRNSPFIELDEGREAILVRQDGRQKRGRPLRLSLKEASRTALSTITTAEFPHLYALRETLSKVRFLEINPRAARQSNDRFEDRLLKSDASNLAAVLARLKDDTATDLRPEGVLSDIASDLTSLIPSVRNIDIRLDSNQRQYSFHLQFRDDVTFSSRVISDGTLRLLALLTVLNDPDRSGTLCFEEPENGVHEGRISLLIDFLRTAAQISSSEEFGYFQILLATHSPKVMGALQDFEIVAADSVVSINPENFSESTRTRMRTGIAETGDMFDPERQLTRSEIDRLLQLPAGAA